MAIPKMQSFLISAMLKTSCIHRIYKQQREKNREFYMLTAGGNRIKHFSSTIKCLFESLMIFTFSVPYRGMLYSQGI